MHSDLISTITMVCRYMNTDYRSKGHGGWLIYEDDKIFMQLDTYVPNIDVYVKHPDKKRTLVLLRAYHGNNQIYHPGKWEDYILAMRDKAVEAKHKEEEEAQAKKQVNHKKLFGPVSDELNEIFSESQQEICMGCERPKDKCTGQFPICRGERRG